MAPFVQSLSQAAVVALALISNVQASPAAARHDSRADKVPLRLMPLGASITAGDHSSTGNGYRKDLRELLVKDGHPINMVGSRKSGSMVDNDNEGWSGFRIGQVEGKARASVPGIKPNLFTINAGTNDCAQGYDIDGAGARMGGMLDYLWGASPGSTVILSTLLLNLNATKEACVERVNEQFKTLAKDKATAGKRIVLVDMHASDGPQKGDMADDTHPNDVGYGKMANIWHRGIRQAEDKGFLQPPNKAA
ncbi:carbohydrate esterase family 3 protein [Purpureocillium lavendulum]|uniref:Carbohydrate esterase family 3 protein n=1 Tax=Purpureocillium lavendulum TaxID=1247861 RepID=A0AB34G3W9_9HYPO|nr:carbohydrate esterase family 3 protein [Purpureocillium lavendulum]